VRRLRPWSVVLIVSLIYLGGIFFANRFDPLTFVTLGTCYSACESYGDTCPANLTKGYDGQFTYYIARSPGGASACLDVPAYRYQRILLPMAGRALAFGNEALLPLAFVIINLAALVGATRLLEDLLADLKVSRWYALVYGLFIGVFMSVRLSTAEPLAYGLVILAIWSGQRGNGWGEAVAYALAALAKETALVFVAGVLLYDLLERRWTHALRLALVAGLPFAAWQLTLKLWLGSFGAGSGGAMNTPFEIIPFNGFWRIAYDPTSDIRLFFAFAPLVIPAAILPSLWAIYNSSRDLRGGQVHLYTCLLLANALLMAFVPFSTYREPLGLFRFLPGLVICHLLYTALRYPRGRALRYAPLWLALSIWLVSG
jgi:hypothetical protein